MDKNQNANVDSVGKDDLSLLKNVTPDMFGRLIQFDSSVMFQNLQKTLLEVFRICHEQQQQISLLQNSVIGLEGDLERVQENAKKMDGTVDDMGKELKLRAGEDDIFSLRFDFNSFQKEMEKMLVDSAMTVNQAKEDMSNLNTEVIQSTFDLTETKTLAEATKAKMEALEERFEQQVTELKDDSLRFGEDNIIDSKIQDVLERKHISYLGAQPAESRLSGDKLDVLAEEVSAKLETRLSQQHQISQQNVHERLERIERQQHDLFQQLKQGNGSANSGGGNSPGTTDALEKNRKQITVLAKENQRSRTEMKQLREFIDRETQRLHVLIETKIKTNGSGSNGKVSSPRGGGSRGSGNPNATDVSYFEKLQANLRENVHKNILDVRNDLSNVGGLVDALSKEVRRLKEQDVKHSVDVESIKQKAVLGAIIHKDKDNEYGSDEGSENAPSGDVLKILDTHSEQLATLLHSKADISLIDQLLEEHRDLQKNLRQNQKQDTNEIVGEEVGHLKTLLDSKAGRDELRSLKTQLEIGVRQNVKEQIKQIDNIVKEKVDKSLGYEDESEQGISGYLGRIKYRCLICDHLLFQNSPAAATSRRSPLPQMGAGMTNATTPFFDLAPNVAFRRWQVKDLIKSARNQEQQQLHHSLGAGSPSPRIRPTTAPSNSLR